MIDLIHSSGIPLMFLYAETHFRFFKFFPSLLYAREPEVIFDLPRRIEPGSDLPILLIINDINCFASEIAQCAVAITQNGRNPERIEFPDLAPLEMYHPFSAHQRVFILPIDRSLLPTGLFHINARVTISCGKKRTVVLNDNLKTTSKLPFSCYAANEPLPGSEFCSYGDLHTHSNYSQSHVEFGTPLEAIDRVAAASGLSFVGITDHSYDLACSIDNYLKSDTDHKRWKLFCKDFESPDRFKTIMMPGEEVSCLNSKNEVVHLCGINIKSFIPGSLDGARKGREKEPQRTIGQVVQSIHKDGGIAFAAHPGSQASFLQKLLLYRGIWSDIDLDNNLDGIQILNSGFSTAFDRGKVLWINMLRDGIKVPLLAGNDAHGDFNRYRAIAKPFISISENFNRFMGYGKTGIYGKQSSMADVLKGIRHGETFITSGPFIALTSTPSKDSSIVSTNVLYQLCNSIYINALSNKEFGPIRSLSVFGKCLGSPQEIPIFTKQLQGSLFTFCELLDPLSLPGNLEYLRAEVECTGSIYGVSRGLTSAVYFGVAS